jgi:hypothetical protein
MNASPDSPYFFQANNRVVVPHAFHRFWNPTGNYQDFPDNKGLPKEDVDRIIYAIEGMMRLERYWENPYGNGDAGEGIVRLCSEQQKTRTMILEHPMT